MRCPNCQSTNPPAASFCLNCGHRFDLQQTQFGGSVAQPQILKTGLALASLILGIISLVTLGIAGIGAIVGLILGIIALIKIKNNPMVYSGKGMAITGVIMNVISFGLAVVVGIIAALATPNVQRQMARANESSTISNILTLEQAEASYFITNDRYASLEKLIEANELNSSWSAPSKMGYRFRVLADKTSYEIFANPENYGSAGQRSFYVKFEEGDDRNAIHAADKHGGDANIKDPVFGGVPGGSPDWKTYPPLPPPPSPPPSRKHP